MPIHEKNYYITKDQPMLRTAASVFWHFAVRRRWCGCFPFMVYARFKRLSPVCEDHKVRSGLYTPRRVSRRHRG
jgi:hypothetical protein